MVALQSKHVLVAVGCWSIASLKLQLIMPKLTKISGVTEIAHQYSDSIPVDKCKGSACFRINLNYQNVSTEQIQALIRISESCRQYFKVSKFIKI